MSCSAAVVNQYVLTSFAYGCPLILSPLSHSLSHCLSRAGAVPCRYPRRRELWSGGACVEHHTSPGPSKRQTSPSPEATDEKKEPSMPSASPISICSPGDHPTIWPLSTESFSPSASLQQ